MASNWADTADAYDKSFARLCAGTAQAILTAVGPEAKPGEAGRGGAGRGGAERFTVTNWPPDSTTPPVHDSKSGEAGQGRAGRGGQERFTGRLLDIGTGTGTLAIAAANRGFNVEAVDCEPTMIEFARKRHKHPNLHFATGCLPDLPYPPSAFDAVIANFVLNHTPDPLGSMRDLRRVAKPGASLGVTIWPAESNALNALWNAVIDRAGAVPPAGMRLPPDKDFERSPGGLRSLLAEAGFEAISVSEMSWTFRITQTDLRRAPEAGIAHIGATYRTQDRRTQERMKAALTDLTASPSEAGELQLPMSAVLGTAHTPS